MAPSFPLVLASSSPYKRALLSRLAIEFDAHASGIDETPKKDEKPTQLADRLAKAKARAVARDFPKSYVLGSDQVIALGDQIFHKPESRQGAIDQLTALQGHTHRLINSICLRTPRGDISTDQVVYEMVMRPLTRSQIISYVDADEPLDCAGSYRIEAAGIRLFEATRGDDPTAIEGLPLTRVWTLLVAVGWTDG